MFKHLHILTLRPMRFIGAGTLVVGCLLALSAIASATLAGSPYASNPGSAPTAITRTYDDTNVVSGGLSHMMDDFGQATSSTGYAVSKIARSITVATAKSGTYITKALGTGASFSGRVLWGTLRIICGVAGFMVHTILGTFRFVGGTALFVVNIPGKLIGHVSDAATVSAVIKPSEQMQVPIIDPGAAAQTAAQATTSGPVPTATASAVQNTAPDSAVAWPIHGEITTQFGVPEPPFQPIHTGLDISDGKARGTTPVHPFKAGRVAGVIHTSSGLGNHVIVDHGDGLTSIYAHLNSTTVQTGQTVDLNTVLGYEGTTGASTGVHLHFEIRVNGQAVDPHGYIGGQP